MVADAANVEQFGPYLVYERLGVGGMATVHRALERGIEGFERIVALKRLLPHLAEDASFIKAFVREAKLASLLNHFNVVQIFELGRVGTQYFISMEYIDGRDIRRILRHARKVTGPPPIHVTVGLLLQLCEALDYAHTKADEHGQPLGLIHRDVSPSNLLITRAGHLKVIDFGIARAQSSQLRTQTGRVKGKLGYMAPEAVAGKDLDARSDLFAVGVIAHELLTARPLFASKNEYQTLLKVQRGELTPPSAFNHACPAELDAIVLQALARDPDQRFRSAAALRDALHELRRRADLPTGHRDVAQWIEWAFSVEPPSGGFAAAHTLDQTSTDHASYGARASAGRPRAPAPTPTPMPTPVLQARRDDDEAAVELAWGGGDAEHDGQPVVLEDVPDVSDKHRAPRLDADVHVSVEDLDDDIPTPQPSHGLLPRARTAGGAPIAALDAAPAGPPRRDTSPGHAPRPRSPSGQAPLELKLEDPSPVATMRNLSSLPPSARVRPGSVAPRDLPSLEPLDAGGAAADPDVDLLRTTRRKRRRSGAPVTIGAALIARRPSRRARAIVAGLVAAAAIAAAAVQIYGRHGRAAPDVAREAPPAPARTAATVKFVTVPEDAEITIEDRPAHRGSPWSIELAAGVHQISIQRSGFKAWLTSIELSANETATLRVVLEPLGGAAASAEATLSLSTTPPGLEVELDGHLLPQRTPLRMPIRPGRRVIVVRQDGEVVWRHEVNARPSVDYEFTPSMTEDKQRERAERESSARGRIAEVRPAIVDADRDERSTGQPRPPGAAEAEAPEPTIGRQIESPALPSIADLAPPAGDPAAPPAPAGPPAPVELPSPKGPVLVAPTAVTRTGGATPTVNSSRRAAVPPVVTAKVCIDTSGRVSSASVLTKLERATAAELTKALGSWTYAPYRPRGAAVPACFVVSLRVK